MVRGSKWMSLGALCVALGVAGAACGGGKSANDVSRASQVSNAGGAVRSDMVTAIPSLSGVGTSVRIDAGTAAALKSLGVSVSPLGSATFDAATSTVTFPITSGYAEIHSDLGHKPGYIVGSIEHSGSGLTLSAGSTKVALSDFVVDPGNSMLYGTVGGSPKVPLLFLDGTNVKVSKDEGGNVVLDGTVAKLTDTAASALNKSFGTTAVKEGLPLGVVHLVAKGDVTTYDASKDKTTAISRLAGKDTSVRLDPSTAKALQQLGVTVTPLGMANFDNSTGTLSFPITGGFAAIHSDRAYKPGYIAGTVLHQASGLKFRKGAKTLEVTDFVVDPGNSLLTATAGGKPGIPLLFLDGTGVQISTDGSAVVLDGTVAKLTAAGASALNSTFGVSAFEEGLPLGVVHLVASGS